MTQLLIKLPAGILRKKKVKTKKSLCLCKRSLFISDISKFLLGSEAWGNKTKEIILKQWIIHFFCFIPPASELSMNLNILKMVYQGFFCWKHLPPNSVAGVQIPASTPICGLSIFGFSPLLQEVFLWVLHFSPLQDFQIPFILECIATF